MVGQDKSPDFPRLPGFQQGQVVQHHCDRCNRDIVTVVSSGARYTAYASVLHFCQLDNEVREDGSVNTVLARGWTRR